ncbi:PIN domain-containing protein [Candidatus Peregrinibacteria bacterium]|nr:PIN domain-containing protein [Candidatus Peregrinibacteria bacterium]
MAEAIPLVDTCIIIEALRGSKKMLRFLKNGLFYYSVITEKELSRKRGLKKGEVIEIEKLLASGKRIFIDTQILEGMRVLAPLYVKKRIRDKNDVIIAATAFVKKLSLFTLNTKHFSFIKGLKLVSLK